jgi:hypothetical protein
VSCAAQFGTNHSVAAALGLQNSFVGNLLLGNTASGLANLGLLAFGTRTPGATDVVGILSKGGAQGIPVPPGNPGWSGAAGQLRGAAVQGTVAATYNAIAGVGQETIELGITASGTIATPAAQLASTTASTIAYGVGLAKFAWDAGTFAYGYAFGCAP